MMLCSPAPSPALTPMPRMQGVPMSLSRYFDRIAIALSAICIVHCLAIPLLVALVPIAAIGFGGAHFHALMLWLVVPVRSEERRVGKEWGGRESADAEYSE